MAFFLPGCSCQGGPLAGGSSAGRADSAVLSRDEQGPEGGEGSYSPAVSREYPYGFGPDDFGIEHGVPPVACGGFSAGDAEGNLYVLDLVNRNIKVLRKTDAALLKAVKLPGEVIGEGPGLPWYIDLAVNENGVIYVASSEAGCNHVVAFDDTGRVLSVYPIPEKIGGNEPRGLIKTREGDVVLSLVDADPEGEGYSFYSFKDGSGRVMGRRYRMEIRGDRREVLELSRFEGGSFTGLGSYGVTEGEEAIVSAGFIGEDGSGNAYVWVQVEKPPLRPESLRLGALKFSEEGKLLTALFVSESDYFAMRAPKFFDVDGEGNLYQVIPAEKRLKVRIWALNQSADRRILKNNCA